MDSYNICLQAANMTNVNNMTHISCHKSIKLSDDIPVLDYYESSPLSTNTGNTTNTTTTMNPTNAPSGSNWLKSSPFATMLVLLLFFIVDR